jgi:anti-sigma regulatory factor (Ser/Thr protein kinase)
MRHGYGGQENQSIVVDCALGAEELVFTIQDHAPHFDPLAPPATGPPPATISPASASPAPASIDEFQPGGQGIRLMRKFAGRLAWEPLPNGNRLTLAFALPH